MGPPPSSRSLSTVTTSCPLQTAPVASGIAVLRGLGGALAGVVAALLPVVLLPAASASSASDLLEAPASENQAGERRGLVPGERWAQGEACPGDGALSQGRPGPGLRRVPQPRSASVCHSVTSEETKGAPPRARPRARRGRRVAGGRASRAGVGGRVCDMGRKRARAAEPGRAAPSRPRRPPATRCPARGHCFLSSHSATPTSRADRRVSPGR